MTSQTSRTKNFRVVLCGRGLAASIAAAALARQLPANVDLTWIESGDDAFDHAYGGVAGPTAYAFNLAAGVTEPHLVLQSQTAFSWGTKFVGWGAAKRTWLQCFHLALPVLHGVPFHHYLVRQGISQLTPFLAPAMAAQQGAFAHPLQNRAPALSRAEYGYQFEPSSYAQLFLNAAAQTSVTKIDSQSLRVERGAAGIVRLHLDGGQTVEGDLYVDCTGPAALLLSALGEQRQSVRRLRVAASQTPSDRVSLPFRTLAAHAFGWQSETPLQSKVVRTTVFDAASETAALAAHGRAPESIVDLDLGASTQVWSHNCVGLGQAAAVLEPLTPAPMLLLQRDIERLVALIPLSTDMAVERREFVRQQADDYAHAEIFNRALFETGHIDAPYWNAARAAPASPKLLEKIRQYESRALLVAFDLEPFNAEDWTILHFGMGRRPARYDRLADRLSEAELSAFLGKMERDIEMTVKAMPRHDAYFARLTQFLKQQHA